MDELILFISKKYKKILGTIAGFLIGYFLAVYGFIVTFIIVFFTVLGYILASYEEFNLKKYLIKILTKGEENWNNE